METMQGPVMIDLSAYAVLLLGYGRLALLGGMLYAGWRRKEGLLRRLFLLLLLTLLLSLALTSVYVYFSLLVGGMYPEVLLLTTMVAILPVWGRTMVSIIFLLSLGLWVQHRQHRSTCLLKWGLYASVILLLLAVLFGSMPYAHGLDLPRVFDWTMGNMVWRYGGNRF
jgi:hypothetical protein